MPNETGENQKNRKIERERLRLRALFKDLGEKSRKLAEPLIARAAFMRFALEELEETIKKDGTLDLFTQGAYSYNREHPAVKSYNATIKNYNATIKQLRDMLPPEASRRASDGDGFDEFILSREDDG